MVRKRRKRKVESLWREVRWNKAEIANALAATKGHLDLLAMEGPESMRAWVEQSLDEVLQGSRDARLLSYPELTARLEVCAVVMLDPDMAGRPIQGRMMQEFVAIVFAEGYKAGRNTHGSGKA